MHRGTKGLAANAAVLLGLIPAFTAYGQSTAPAGSTRGHFQIYNASVSAGYSSLPLSNETGGLNLGTLAADYYATSSATVGYSSSGLKSSTSLLYTPTYVRRARFSELSSVNHSLAFSNRRTIAPHSTLQFSINGVAASIEQLAFSQSALTRAAQASGTSDEFAQAIGGQPTDNTRLSRILASQGAADTALLTAIYGGRLITGTAALGYMFQPSTRTRWTAAGDFMRAQPLGSNESGSGIAYGLKSTAMGGSLGWSHNITPRLVTGFSGQYRRSRSGYYNGDVYSTEMTVGRQFRRIWFANVNAGAGRVSWLSPSGLGSRMSSTYTATLVAGFRARSQTVVFSGKRGIGDNYGLGSGSTTSIDGTWNWSRPGRTWNVFTAVSRQEMLGGYAGKLVTWHGEAGSSKQVSRHTTVAVSLAYVSTDYGTRPQVGVLPDMSGYHARITFGWTPGGWLE